MGRFGSPVEPQRYGLRSQASNEIPPNQPLILQNAARFCSDRLRREDVQEAEIEVRAKVQ